MWEYNYTPNINEMYHAAIGVTRSNRANHKYIDRYKGKNGKWVYVYDEKNDKSGSRQNKEVDSEKSRSVFSEYTKDDPDFKYALGLDDKTQEAHRLGDTDFFGFTREDGTAFIIEEDMKWVLPKGTVITKDLVRRLEKMAKDVERLSDMDGWNNDAWVKVATETINGDRYNDDKYNKNQKSRSMNGNTSSDGRNVRTNRRVR